VNSFAMGHLLGTGIEGRFLGGARSEAV